MGSHGFAGKVIVEFPEDGPISSLWIREDDGAVIYFSKGRDSGLGNLNEASFPAYRKLLEAFSVIMGSIRHTQALTVPAPRPELTTMFRAVEDANVHIGFALPQAHYFPPPPKR